MATLKLTDYNFSGIDSTKEESPAPEIKTNPTLEVPELATVPQEPFVVSEALQEEEFNFSGLLQVKKAGRSNAVSSEYGKRKAPTKGASSFHDGLDIPLDPNTPLKPFGKGTVIFAGNRKGYGKSVGIDYGNGVIIYVNHLNRIDLELDDRVTADAIVGLSGNTGVSTGPHVHVQALKDGVSIDPRKIFNEDPSKAGLALTIRGLLEDVNVIEESSEDTFDFSGLTEIQEEQEQLDFSGVTPTTENNEIDTDVLKFNPVDKPKGVGYGQLFTEGFAPHLKEMAQGIASVEQFRFKPRTKNPNEPGKPITFDLDVISFSMDGRANDHVPPIEMINEELAKVLGLTNLNNKFKNDKDFKTGKAGTPLVYVDNPDIKRNQDGTWRITIPYGMSSGSVELVNAYARGGAKAFSEKRKDIENRLRIYQEDLEEQKLKHQRIQNFQKEHPYLALLLDPTKPFKRGLQDLALGEIQLMHSITMLPRAIWTSNVHGTDSEEYLNLMKEDAKTQIEIDKAHTAIPKEEILPAKLIRAGTSAIGTLPRFAAIGKLGGWALPTLTYVENLHRGNTEAVKAALPMAVMVGSMRGIEKFIEVGGNPLDIFRRSEIANKDVIASIRSNSTGNYDFHLMSNLEPMGIPIRTIDFKAISPFQRQLVLRGSNAISNVGTTIATNPQSDFDTLIEQAFIGLALPIGKGVKQKARGFEQRSIIKGDAYTLPDGSVLLRAPIDNASELIGGRIPRDGTIPYYPSAIEQNAPTSNEIGRQLSTTKIIIPGADKVPSVHVSIDQAALNLLSLRRAYEQGDYMQGSDSTQRKQDLLAAIKVLDDAIPKETQEYFAANEALIREAIRTNYESRLQKEEFVKGQRILRKSISQLTLDDARPYNPQPIARRTSIDNFSQWARRSVISVEEAGRRGLEANQKNKGTFNAGIDPSDIPYFVQIGIGKLGRKSLDATEFVREMAAEHGEDFFKYGMEVFRQAKNFVDGLSSLRSYTDKYLGMGDGILRATPFEFADAESIKKIYNLSGRYINKSVEQDVPIDKIVATQKYVSQDRIIKFAEEPDLAAKNPESYEEGHSTALPRFIKINDLYYMFDGHHRSTAEKLKNGTQIRGKVADLDKINNSEFVPKPIVDRAKETFGETGKNNKWFTQEKQVEIRENFLKPPDASELQEGFTTAPKWVAQNFSNLVQITGFHVEDAYRRGIEPKLEDIIGRLRTELGDWVDSIPFEKWNEIIGAAKKFYETNNADPFYSGLKQHVLEVLPNRFDAKMFYDLYIKPTEGVVRKGDRKGEKVFDENKFLNEVSWTVGLQEWIEGKVKTGEKINKNELIDYIERNQVKVDEVVLSQPTKEDTARLNQIDLEIRRIVDEENGVVPPELYKERDELETRRYAPSTRYDLKTYTSERLELEGGRNPKEVLLKLPQRGTEEMRKDFIQKKREEIKQSIRERDNYTELEQMQYLGNIIKPRNDGTIKKYFRENDEMPYPYDDNTLLELWGSSRDRIDSELYSTPHWDEKNLVAHFRANERETIDRNKVFHSEEFQSDWNQQGRKEGYRLSEKELEQYYTITKHNTGIGYTFTNKSRESDSFVAYGTTKEAAIKAAVMQMQYDNKVPQNPFMENNWKELSFKRFLRMGIEMGKDGVSWTTARQQQERYKKTLEGKVIWPKKNSNGTYDLNVEDSSSTIISNDLTKNLTREQVINLTSETIANNIDEALLSVKFGDTLPRIELDKSIDFSKGYSDYDTYFVNLAKKIAKKFGDGTEYKIKEIETGLDKVEYERISTYEAHELFEDGEPIWRGDLDGNVYAKATEHSTIDSSITYREVKKPKVEKVHYLEITPKMRDSILKEGQPLYGLSSTESLKPSAPTGIRNRLITRDIFDRAKSEVVNSITDLVDNEGGNQTVLNSGLNPDAFLDNIKLLYKGWQDFEAFSSSMIRRYGEKVSPHLESIWNWTKESKLHQDERGFLNFGKKKRLYTGQELTTFNDNRSSRFRNISLKAHRGIANAQTYESFGQVYNSLRGLQRTTNAYSTTILEQLSRAVTLLKKDTDQKVAQAIFTRNKEAINSPTEDANIIARFGLTPEQIRAYHYIRSSVSNVLDLRRDQLLYREHQNIAHINEQLTTLGLPTGGTPINAQHADLLTKLVDTQTKIQSVEDYYQGLKDSGYISLQRLGRYRAELENPNVPSTITSGTRTIKNPDRFLIDYADSPKEAQRRINEWKEQLNLTNDGRILDAKNPSDFKEISRKLTPGEFEELISGAGVANTPEVEAIRAEVYEKYPTMGYQLERKLYPGYRENNEFMIKSIAHQAETYASSYYNNIGREEGLRALDNTGIEKTDKELWNVARQFIEDETSTPQYNNVDKLAFKARKFTYLMQLGYQVKQLYLNAFVQPITQNYNYIARVENPTTGKRIGGIGEVEKIFTKGARLSLQLAKARAEELIGINKIRSPEFLEFQSIYNQLKNERVIEPEYTKSLLELEAEEASAIDNQFRSRTRNFFSWKQQEHWSGVFMRAGEHTTRTQIAASMFYTGKKFGLSGDALTEFIVRGIDSTQTNPSRGENPYYIRKMGETGKLFYQFGAFRHMWLENLVLNAKSDWKHRSIAASSRTLAPLAIISGISGLPLTGFAFTLYSLATGNNPDERLKRWVRNKIADNNYLESLALYGATGSAGFSQSAGIQMPVVDTLTEQLTEDSWWDKVFSSNIPALMTTKQIGQGLSGVAAAAYDGDVSKIVTNVISAAPVPGNKPARDITKAIEVSNDGYKTKAGDTILSRSKTTNTKVLAQVFGIAPNEVVESYRDKRYKKLRTSEFGKASRRTYRKLIR